MIADINLERGDMARTTDSKLLIGLMLLPIFYFGMQLLLAPYFPGYSLLRDATSILGSDRSPVAHWFNVLAIVGDCWESSGHLALTVSYPVSMRAKRVPLFSRP
jgi:hypothetical protein